MSGKIKVLIIDDSALVRKILRTICEKDPGIEVVDTAQDPVFAVEKIKKFLPDVLTLDIEMPRMDGLTFLEKLMMQNPVPAVMISSLTARNAEITLRALELGAFDYVEKPKNIQELETLAETIIEKIKAAGHSSARSRLISIINRSRSTQEKKETPALITRQISTTDRIIALGSSTGGTVAIAEILKLLPVNIPGMVIVQHMPGTFTRSFAGRLNSICSLHVKEASDGDQIRDGFVYIAPGGLQCSIYSSGAKYFIKIQDGPPVNRHKPSVAVLFNSVANYAGKNAVGVMLTGMGDDGARAMRQMKDAGSFNIVQDEESSVVWGMPGSAVKYEAHNIISPLGSIAGEIIKAVSK
ncbi:MAG: chemotaxis response regulator protein-glutamate methylesterase [Spirochaetes bacterium GWF1_41_5]|nr:MAG: chemotaxis response regulator protein-glutamate methylesterase [Spirochaetes bacterium GWF1_41_5]